MTLAAIEALQSLRAILIEDPKLCVEVPDPLTVNIFKKSRDQEIALVDLAIFELQCESENGAGDAS